MLNTLGLMRGDEIASVEIIDQFRKIEIKGNLH